VPLHGDGKFQLGAHAVGRRHEDRIAIAGGSGVKERSEAAERRRRSDPRRGARQWLDRLDQRIAGVDVDPGRLVGEAVYGVLPADAL
jgi:hypothetical protein